MDCVSSALGGKGMMLCSLDILISVFHHMIDTDGNFLFSELNYRKWRIIRIAYHEYPISFFICSL